MKLKTSIVLSALLAASAWQVAADDLVLPGWARPTGQPGGNPWATWSVWDTFKGAPISANPWAGAIYSDAALWGSQVWGAAPRPAPYPITAAGDFTGRANFHSLGDFAGRTTVAGLSGDISFVIPNTPPDPMREKYMHIQVTWKPDPSTPNETALLHADSPGLLSIDDNGWTQTTTTLPDGWNHTVFDGIGFIDPHTGKLMNPAGETFQLHGNIFVDQVVIDTVCVPEPGQVVLTLVLCAAAYGYRRYTLRRQS